jgi:hypothetical protein
MAETNGPEPIEYLSVRISGSSVAEMDGASPAVELPGKDIERLELMYGVAAERPAVQLILGAILMLTGVFPVRTIVAWVKEGGTLDVLHLGILVFAMLGALLIKGVFTKRHFLRVVTATDARKVVFRGKVEETQLVEFLRKARESFPYSIISTLSRTQR